MKVCEYQCMITPALDIYYFLSLEVGKEYLGESPYLWIFLRIQPTLPELIMPQSIKFTIFSVQDCMFTSACCLHDTPFPIN